MTFTQSRNIGTTRPISPGAARANFWQAGDTGVSSAALRKVWWMGVLCLSLRGAATQQSGLLDLVTAFVGKGPEILGAGSTEAAKQSARF